MAEKFTVEYIKDAGWLEEECNKRCAVIPAHGDCPSTVVVETQLDNDSTRDLAWARCQFCKQYFPGEAF